MTLGSRHRGDVPLSHQGTWCHPQPDPWEEREEKQSEAIHCKNTDFPNTSPSNSRNLTVLPHFVMEKQVLDESGNALKSNIQKTKTSRFIDCKFVD